MSKLLFAKIWMGIVYTFLGALMAGLIGLLVWAGITNPEFFWPILVTAGIIAVSVVCSALAKLTMWAMDTIEENK